jgi:hypothetical protein
LTSTIAPRKIAPADTGAEEFAKSIGYGATVKAYNDLTSVGINIVDVARDAATAQLPEDHGHARGIF